MALVAPASVDLRGYTAGSRVPTAPVTSLTAPTVSVQAETGRVISVSVTSLDPYADGVEIYLDADATPTTLVITAPWFVPDPYVTGDLGEGVTRYARARAYVDMPDGRVYSEYSAVGSATTDSAVPSPGSPFGFSFTANGDGTVDATWSLPDAYHDAIYLEIWRASPAGWVTLRSSGAGTLELNATSASDVAVPGSSGATPNGSGEYGLRIRTQQGGVNTIPSEYWAPVQQAPSPATAGTLGTSGQTVTLVTAPTNYSAMQLQYTTTPGSPGSWQNVTGIDATGDFPYAISGLGLGYDVTAAFRLAVTPSGGGSVIYSDSVQITTPAAPGSGSLIWGSNFNSGQPAGISFYGSAQMTTASQRVYGGTGGAMFAPYTASAGTQAQAHVPLLSYNLREIYCRFYARIPTPRKGGCKFWKVMGQRTGPNQSNYSNFSFVTEGSNGNLRGVLFGEGIVASNDAQNYVRFNGTHNLTRSTPTFYTTSAEFKWDDNWHLFELYFKQNSVVGGVAQKDGRAFVKIDGVMRMDARNFINRHDDSGPFEIGEFFSYTEAGDGPWEMCYDNIAISTGDFVVVS